MVLPRNCRTPFLSAGILPVSFIFRIFCNCCKLHLLADFQQRQVNRRRTQAPKAFHWGSATGIRYSQSCLDLPWNTPHAAIEKPQQWRSPEPIHGFPEPSNHSASIDTKEARTCEAWFQLTFRPQKWNLKAHMWYQLSPFTGSNVAIAMQHDPGNIQHQDKSFSSWLAAATLSP